MLFRLINGAALVIQIRRLGVFDVRPQHMGDGVTHRELRQTIRAGGVRGHAVVGHVQTARIQTVASQEIARKPVVQSDARFMMARDRDHIDDPAP